MKGPCKIHFMDGAKDSLHQAASDIPGDAKVAIAGISRLIERLAEGIQLHSPEQFRKEAGLPNGRPFFAVRTRNGLRCYGWYSVKTPGTFVVSHFRYKKRGPLAKKDTQLVVSNFRRYENG